MALSSALVVHIDKPLKPCSASISPRCGSGWMLTKSRRLNSTSSVGLLSVWKSDLAVPNKPPFLSKSLVQKINRPPLSR